MNDKRMPLTYDDPLVAVFLRTLAWELYVARPGENLLVKEITEEHVREAREDLGFKKTEGGAADAFIQSLRKPEKPLLGCNPTRPEEKGWQNEWRLLYLPNHRFVRVLSDAPVCVPPTIKRNGNEQIQFSLLLRTPALPRLTVTVGSNKPDVSMFEKAPRGLYFLREPEKLYVGQTNEFGVRYKDHTSSNNKEPRKIIWWVFVAPEEENSHFALDSLDAAEGLLISFWTEICRTTNRKRGKDTKPAPVFLQPAVLLVEAASAALIWLMREHADWFAPLELPFKACRAKTGRSISWPQCYLEPSNDEPKSNEK